MQRVTLKGPRLSLSNDLSPEYAEELAYYANNLKVANNIGSHSFPYPYTKEDAMFFLTKNREEGKSFFAMDLIIRLEGNFAGVIGISEIDWSDMKAHIGYWIAEPYWNRGYATEALKIMVDYCRNELKLVRLYTKVLDYNFPSLKVLMKNGFSVEGYERKSMKMEDGYHSLFIVSRIFD